VNTEIKGDEKREKDTGAAGDPFVLLRDNPSCPAVPLDLHPIHQSQANTCLKSYYVVGRIFCPASTKTMSVMSWKRQCLALRSRIGK